MVDHESNLLTDAYRRVAWTSAYALLSGAVLGWLTWPLFIVLGLPLMDFRAESVLHSIAMFLLALVPAVIGLAGFVFETPRPLPRSLVFVVLPVAILAYACSWLGYLVPLAFLKGLARGPSN